MQTSLEIARGPFPSLHVQLICTVVVNREVLPTIADGLLILEVEESQTLRTASHANDLAKSLLLAVWCRDQDNYELENMHNVEKLTGPWMPVAIASNHGTTCISRYM